MTTKELRDSFLNTLRKSIEDFLKNGCKCYIFHMDIKDSSRIKDHTEILVELPSGELIEILFTAPNYNNSNIYYQVDFIYLQLDNRYGCKYMIPKVFLADVPLTYDQLMLMRERTIERVKLVNKQSKEKGHGNFCAVTFKNRAQQGAVEYMNMLTRAEITLDNVWDLV